MTTARFDSIRLKLICVALVAAYPVLAEAGVAGRVQFVAGDVRVVDDKGNARAMRKGQEVSEGDTVLSGADGSAQLKMIDGAIVAVRPGTELKVIDYVFDESDSSKENASFSLVKGGLRAITGLIGKTNKDKYKLATPTATIGIRGTDHEPVVVLPGVNGASADAPPGTYDKVNVGATTLSNQAGTTVIAANQVGFAASPTQLPVILPTMPDFYRATPAPKQQGKKQDEQKQEKQEKQAEASSQGSEKSSDSDAKPDAATAATTAPAASLTAVDASGNTLNLSNQTLTTASGQLLSLSGDALSGVQTPVAFSQVLAAFPAKVSDTDSFSYPAVFFAGTPSQLVSRDASGHLVGVTDNGTDLFGYRSSLSQSGAAMTDLGKDAATGLSWGRWQGGTVTNTIQYVGMDANGKWGLGAENDAGTFVIGGSDITTAALGNGSLHWISGGAAVPGHLAQVLTGSATYNLIGGTRPTDQSGNLGTLNSASLGVNFTTQVANANINFSIGGNTWGMQSGDMLLNGPHFSSHNACDEACTSNVSLTKNGAAIGLTPTTTASFGSGSMNGALLGAGLNGAALQYAVQESTPVTQTTGTGQTFTSFSHNVIQGVAGFSGPTQDVNTPFRVVGITDGWGSGLEMIDNEFAVDAGDAFRGSVDGTEAPVSRIVDGPGGLTEFLGSARGYTLLNSPTASSSDFDIASTVKIGSAINRDVGSTTIGGTTVSWGRWEGGSVDIYSRDGSAKLGTIDNSGRSIHWLTSSALTSFSTFASLPLTGSATYTLAGNTSPTDFKGNVGTLNSATLSADFSNAKVNAGVNVSFNAPTNTSNWTMSATNIPLGGKDGFGSSTVLNGVNGVTHTATCTGASCGAKTIGHVDGVFVNGAQGAVFIYGMATGSATAASTFVPANAATGVVVMKR